MSEAVLYCKTHTKPIFQIQLLRQHLKFICNSSEIWLVVGASGATQCDAWVNTMELFAVASASMKVLLGSLLVGCAVVNVAKGCILTGKVAGKVACKIKSMVHRLLLPLQHT